MRIATAVAAIVFLLQPGVYAQSSLSFARMIDAGEMSNVGFAIINPSKEAAETTFTLYGVVGQVIGTSKATVPAGGQLTRLAAQLFPQAPAGGWVQATSDVSGLRGFWMTGDAVTVGDNVEAETANSQLLLPLITITSEITVVNTGSRNTAIRIKLYNVNGRQVSDPVVRVLPPKGVFRAPATSLFTPFDWSSVTHAKISSGAPIVGAAEVRDFRFAPSLLLVNAVSVSAGPSTIVFPHVLQGQLGDSQYVTTLGITNLNSSPQTMTLTFYPADGSPPQIIQQTYPGNGGVRASARTIFGFGDEFRLGWVKVSATRGAVGFASNADVAKGVSAISPGMSRPESTFILGYIAAVPPAWTGLTLVNPGTTTATVDLFAIAPDGSLIGGPDDTSEAHFSILPGGKTSRLLSELIPRTQSLRSNGGFIFVRSSLPLYPVALSFNGDRHILSVVPEFDLPPTGYDPPRPQR
nr:hypothetical protein Hi04_10k_c1170_00022 [uncultured bacterium]